MKANLVTTLALVVGCGPPPPLDAPIDATASTSGGTTSSSGSGLPWPTAPTTDAPATDSGAGDDSTAAPPDTLDHWPCSTLAQDCPRGEKCVPWILGGGSQFNGTTCVDVPADAAQLDAPCTVDMSSGVWLDDCDVGLVCWDGTCRQICGRTSCPRMHGCAHGDWFAFCYPQCDPLADDCDRGEVCFPVDNRFICGADASGISGVHGDPCRYLNSCDPGFVCIGGKAHTACESKVGCCAMFCDLTDPLADDACAALDPGQSCEAWWIDGMAPEGYENVGVCALPLGGG